MRPRIEDLMVFSCFGSYDPQHPQRWCRISSEMRHENAARFSNLRQEKGCALFLNPKHSSSHRTSQEVRWLKNAAGVL